VTGTELEIVTRAATGILREVDWLATLSTAICWRSIATPMARHTRSACTSARGTGSWAPLLWPAAACATRPWKTYSPQSRSCGVRKSVETHHYQAQAQLQAHFFRRTRPVPDTQSHRGALSPDK
jgi:hypothetical protein